MVIGAVLRSLSGIYRASFLALNYSECIPTSCSPSILLSHYDRMAN